MSPALKSKSKDKSSGKVTKEQQKISSKPSVLPASNAITPNVYNPPSAPFHPLEMTHTSSLLALQNNSLVGNADETEDHSVSSLGTSAECDTLSNNGSCSGESEDQKDKVAASTASVSRPVTIPGCDTDKREKIRQKNEKKHQRQKEKRAQELHERCSGYLMSRKLETLSQQLVVMGFPAERATMALILNEGRVEDSVSWLFDGGMEAELGSTTNGDGGSNLKIDISEELTRIAEIEIKLKSTKQEVERAVVTCEGDLEKAVEILKAQKQEPPPPHKAGENCTQTAMNGVMSKAVSSTSVTNARLLGKPFGSDGLHLQNHSKVLTSGSLLSENGNTNVQSLRGLQSKSDWARAQTAAVVDDRWPSATLSQSASHSLASSLQVSPIQLKAEELRNATVGSEAKSNLKVGNLREPVIVMQRPQSVKINHNPPSTSINVSTLPPATTGWYPNGGAANIEMTKAAGQGLANGVTSLNLGMRNTSLTHPFFHQSSHRSFQAGLTDGGAVGWSDPWRSTETSNGTPSFSLQSSSLGSFTPNGCSMGFPSALSSDWCADGLMSQCDYTSIDWSHDLTPFRRSGPTSLKTDRLHETWSTAFMGARAVRPAISSPHISGLLDRDLVFNSSSSVMGSYDWTTPFTGKDLFRAPRQFVSSPPL